MGRPTGSSHVASTMAVVVAAGGVMGYIRRRSLPSLAAGLGIGAVFGLGAHLTNTGRPDVGHPLGLVASLALVAAMTPRAIRSGKLFPAGILAIAGWASSAYEAKQTLDWLG